MIDLDRIERITSQQRQGRLAGAEVIHRQFDAETAELSQQIARSIGVAHDVTLADLELQALRGQTQPFQPGPQSRRQSIARGDLGARMLTLMVCGARSAAAYHHRPHAAPAPHRDFVALVNLGEGLALACGCTFALEPVFKSWDVQAMDCLALAQLDMERVAAELPPRVEGLHHALAPT